ncbi:MAG: DUF692 domain-containing protein [Candidatus Melainabacteria bacterium]|nr:DUF692 domain-containing protein [Candidatus Melainabacteria bacterium]
MDKNKLSKAGLGLGLRRALTQETLDFYSSENNTGLIEWLEIVPENYIYLGGRKAQQFQEVLDSGVALIPHGVNLSIGTAPETPGKPCFDPYLIDGCKELFQQIEAPWFSDHISCTRVGEYYLQNLIPVPMIQESVDIIADNVKFLQDEFQLPFLVENPSFYSTIIDAEMSEAQFINSILEQADCGMLLDVNNIYVNATNHGNYQPVEFLDSLMLERVVQVHIAGHLNGYHSHTGHKIEILDTHGEGIIDEVYEILRQLLARTEVNAILLERDSNFPELKELVEELKQIQGVVARSACDAAIQV